MARNRHPARTGVLTGRAARCHCCRALRTAMTPAGRRSLARTLRVLPHAAHASHPCPGTPRRTSGRARLVRLGLVILLAVTTGSAVLRVVRRQARRQRSAPCRTRAGRQWRWPVRLRRAATRTDTWLLIATLVLVALAFLTLLIVSRPAGSADGASAVRWPCPAAAAQPAHPERRRAAEGDPAPGRPSREWRAPCCTGRKPWPGEGVNGPGR